MGEKSVKGCKAQNWCPWRLEAPIHICLMFVPVCGTHNCPWPGRRCSSVDQVCYNGRLQALLTTLAAETGFPKNKHLFKLLQALGRQFWLKSRAAKPALLLMQGACKTLQLLEHPLGNFLLLFLKKTSKLPSSPSQSKQDCETWKLQEPDLEPGTTWSGPFPQVTLETASQHSLLLSSFSNV